jgi:hypothetical protein
MIVVETVVLFLFGWSVRLLHARRVWPRVHEVRPGAKFWEFFREVPRVPSFNSFLVEPRVSERQMTHTVMECEGGLKLSTERTPREGPYWVTLGQRNRTATLIEALWIVVQRGDYTHPETGANIRTTTAAGVAVVIRHGTWRTGETEQARWGLTTARAGREGMPIYLL